MCLGPTEKARQYINNVKGSFCMQQVAEAIGCERQTISSLAKNLRKDKCIEFVEKKPFVKGGPNHKFFKCIKKSDVIKNYKNKAKEKPAEIIYYLDTPWHKFCLGKL